MGKFIQAGVFLLLLSTNVMAEELAVQTQPPTTGPVIAPTTAAATTPSSTSTTTTTTTTTTTPTKQADSPQKIDCQYKIPATTTKIEDGLVKQWAEKAAQQSFDFENATLNNQLLALKACYTDQGWLSFNDALQKSGNLNAIKTQKLNVSSMVMGSSIVAAVKDNQWKVSVPLQVVYQNDKEKITQMLSVDLLVGRKLSGDLGIMQMIASPKEAKNAAAAAKTTETVTEPAKTAQ